MVSAIARTEVGEVERTAEAEWVGVEALVTNWGGVVVVVEEQAAMGMVEGATVMAWERMGPVRAAAGHWGAGTGLAAAALSLLHR
mmetsp:Transcript_19911/g.53670  ORF Transcript_19911/g.53670 Transcript_19911/m.53670 type:complete len:85 (+) Transcript_19911:659-913(+)